MYYLKTLGALSLSRPARSEDDGLSGSKSLLIVALLATTPERSERRDHLAELLWPGSDRARALRALRQALFYLSKYANDVLDRDDETVTLARDQLSADLWEFDDALRRGDFGHAIALYGGRFLAGLERKAGSELEHWIEAENSRINAGLEVAYTKEIERRRQAGELEEAMRLARAYADLNPLDDRGQRTLLRTLLAAGDELGALRAYEGYRTLVTNELGEEPPEELRRNMEEMREELLRVAGPAVAGAAAVPPGSRAYPAGRWRRWVAEHRLVAAGAAGALAVAIVLGVAVAAPWRSPPSGPVYNATGRLLVTVDRGSRSELEEIALRGTGVDIRATNLGPNDLPAPDGRRVAFTERSPDGWNLAVRETGSAEARTLTRDPGDEFPVAWSPDGRHLVYAHRRLLDDGRSYAHELAVLDLEAESSRSLGTLPSPDAPRVAWAPDGTRLAVTSGAAGATEIYVVDFDGANAANLSRHPRGDRDPAWSPDRERLAFVSDRDGAADLYTIRPDGTDLRQITVTAGEERGPVWLSPSLIAFVTRRGDASDLWLADTFTGALRQVTTRGDIGAIVGVRDAPRRWIETVAITPRGDVVSPGQYVDLDIEATDASGEPATADGLPLRWSVRPDSVATVNEAGALRVVGRGPAAVVASLGGWRADTLAISSVEIAEVPLEPVLAEPWTNGIDQDRWLTFGDPAPRTTPTGAPGRRGTFVNNGDAIFESGAVTRAAFPLESGLTVEVHGRLRFTGKLHQVFGIALYREASDDSLLATGEAVPLVELRIQGAAGPDPAQAWIATAERRHAIPVPERPRFWHRYALQILPDGAVELLVDGAMYWRSPYRLARELLTPVYVGLGFQSFETDVAHGPVGIYSGARYRLREVEAVVAGEAAEPR